MREGRYRRAVAGGSLREGSCCMAVVAWQRAVGYRAVACKAAGSGTGGCGLQRIGVEAVKAQLHNRTVENAFYLLHVY